MSGGRYGPRKAPERRCLPLAHWPEPDRLRWQHAILPADVLDEGGARAGHSPISNTKAAKGYGRWITHLKRRDPQALKLDPEERITPERVRAYVDELVALGNSTRTVLARLQELEELAHVMGPNRSWRFLQRIAARVRARHVPARDKANLQHSDELLELGLTLMEQGEAREGLAAALTYRDGLLIALLTLVPLRRRNLAGLVLGHTILRQASQWLIAFGEEQTKTHAPYETPVPALLTGPLDRYVAHHRELLKARTGRWSSPAGAALWISKDGSPMTQIALYDRICACTKAAFGQAVNPHLFRDAAATTLALADPERVRAAAPLLGHRTFTTTERHYLHAQAHIAHRTYLEALFPARRSTQ